jgi:hypothetical protein
MNETAYRHFSPPRIEELEDRFDEVDQLQIALALALVRAYGQDEDFARQVKQSAEMVAVSAEAYRGAISRMRHQYEAEHVIPALLAPFFARPKS